MSIKIFENGAYKDVVALSSDGYYFIVAPNINGTKVWQPGTRGAVFSDTLRTMLPSRYCPNFVLKEASPSTGMYYKTNNSTSGGYAVVEKTPGGTILMQNSEQFLWAMDSSLRSDCVYLFPRSQRSTIYGVLGSWGFGYMAKGDKPITDCTSYNESGARYIRVNKQTYKNEFYVIITIKCYETSRSMDPNHYVYSVYVPYERPDGYNGYFTLSCTKHAGRQHLNLQGYAIYQYESKVNFGAGIIFGSPIIALDWASAGLFVSQSEVCVRVQSVYSFKDD